MTRDQVIEAYEDLLRPIALSLKERLPASIEVDDLVHWGWFGLSDAADRYDEKRADSFESYVRLKIRGRMLDEARKEYRDATHEQVDENVYQLRASEPLPDAIVEGEQTLEQLARAIDTLSERQKKVIVLRFDRGLTQQEAGEELGISQVSAHHLEARAVAALRKVMLTA